LRVAAAPDAQAGTFQRTIRYAYDDLNRLTSAQESGSTTNTFTYTYDWTGNRTDERPPTNDERGLGCL
jgi:hypothetical protein